jgi:hypothetical protein
MRKKCNGASLFRGGSGSRGVWAFATSLFCGINFEYHGEEHGAWDRLKSFPIYKYSYGNILSCLETSSITNMIVKRRCAICGASDSSKTFAHGM